MSSCSLISLMWSDVGDAGVEEFDASSLETFLAGDDGVVRLSLAATAALLQFLFGVLAIVIIEMIQLMAGVMVCS